MLKTRVLPVRVRPAARREKRGFDPRTLSRKEPGRERDEPAPADPELTEGVRVIVRLADRTLPFLPPKFIWVNAALVRLRELVQFQSGAPGESEEIWDSNLGNLDVVTHFGSVILMARGAPFKRRGAGSIPARPTVLPA